MELPVVDFIRQIISEANPEFNTGPGTAYYDMFVKPQQLMLQPLNNTMDQVLVAQSIRLILQQPFPDQYSEDDVDNLVGNVYVTRDPGAFASGGVRVFYAEPLAKEFPAFTAEFTSGTLSFFNSSDISITAAQMALQTIGSLYYMDVVVRAQAEGSQYIVDIDTINAFINDTDAVRVTNLAKTVGGLTRETNTKLLIRAQNSIGVRDLETVKGINAILTSNFTFISSLYAIGMGDPEMQRDIVYNTHVGGYTDVYIKTPSLTVASQDFVAMDYDFTRSVPRQLHLPLARSYADPNVPSYTGTPQIVASSVTVREDVIETAATIETIAIPPTVGIDLSGREWIHLSVDFGLSKMIKISGVIPAQTQRFEILNSINAALGIPLAATTSGNRLRLTSPNVGSVSSIQILPVTVGHNEGSLFLFGLLSLPATYSGTAAEVYLEDRDFTVDYVNGLVAQTPYNSRGLPTILSNQVMISGVSNGQITQSGGNLYFGSTTPNQFYTTPGPTGPAIKVRVGDTVKINNIGGVTSGTQLGDLPQTFLVSSVVGGDITVAFPLLTLDGLTATGSFPINSVNYTITSNQVVVIDYNFHPISIDIGAQVLQPDGLTRGMRAGREAYTLKDTPFIDIVAINEIDPQSGEIIGPALIPPRGYGYGGYGEGGYGQGIGGEYEFRILAPRDRFSVFDDAIIMLDQNALTLSYRVTYKWVPEIVTIHNLARNDAERVTGADVLPRSYVPCFVDVAIEIRRVASNLSTPPNADLAVLVQDYVNGRTGPSGVAASDISKILEDQGVDTVKTPFLMTGTLLNTDGTTLILESEDVLIFPDITLERDTIAYATKRIVHFFPGTITVSEVI